MTSPVVGTATVTLGVDASTFGPQAKVQIERQLRTFRPEVKLKPVIDRAAIRQVNAEIGRISPTIRLKAELDQRSLNQVRAQVAGIGGIATAPKLQVMLTLAQGARAKLQRELDHITPPLTVRVTPILGDLNRRGLGGAATTTVRADVDKKSFGDALIHVTRLAGAIKSLALPAAAIGSIPSILGLGAALATAAQSAAILPGVMAAGGFAFGALKLGVSGFGEALANVGDPEKFAEAIAGLSPAARDAAVAVRDLRPAFLDMKNAVQDQLFAGLSDVIRDLGERYMPVLQGAFTRIAGSANLAALGVGEMLSTSSRIRDVTAIGDDASVSFGALFEAVKPLSAAFLDVATVGSSFLPGLTAGAGGAAQAFADMIAKARETGKLHEFISQGLSALGDLGTIAGNVGVTLGNIYTAANISGAGFLGNLKEITGSLREVTGSVAGQEALGSFFAAIGTVARTLGDTLKAIAPSLAVILDQAEKGIAVLAPAIAPLAAAAGQVLAALAPLLPVVGSIAASIGGALTPVVSSLVPVAAQLAEMLGPFLGQAMAQLAPLITELGTSLARILLAALQAIQPILPDIATLLGQLVAVAMPLIPVITDLAVVFIKLLGPILPIITKALIVLVDLFAPFVAPVLALVAAFKIYAIVVKTITFLTKAWAIAQALFNIVLAANPITLIVIALAALAVGIVAAYRHSETFRDIVQGAFDAVKVAAFAVWDVIKVAMDGIVVAFNAVSTAVMWLWQNVIQPAWTGIQVAIGIASTAIGIYIDGIKLYFSALQTAGQLLWDGLMVIWDGISFVVGVAKDAIGLYIDGVKLYFEGMKTAAQFLWDGLVVIWDGIKFVIDGARAAIGFYIDGIKLYFDGLRMAAQFLWDGIKFIWDGIGATINAVVTGPISNAFTAFKTGIDGVKTFVGNVVDTIEKTWSRISGIFETPIRFFIGTVFNRGIVVAWNAIINKIPGVGRLDPVAGYAEGGKIEGYATGGRVDSKGVIHGPGTGTSDSIWAQVKETGRLIKVSAKERIIPAEQEKKYGGFFEALRHGNAEAVQATGGPGRHVYGFADGGPLTEQGRYMLARGASFARQQVGKPYIWGGVGPGGFDCSGYMSAITNAIRGNSLYQRLGVARSQPWAGFRSGLGSAFATGFSQTHTAGTLNGVNVESTPPRVRMGAGAAGANAGQFGGHAYLPTVGGTFQSGGGGGGFFDPMTYLRKIFGGVFDKIAQVPGDPSELKSIATSMPKVMVDNAMGWLKDKVLNVLDWLEHLADAGLDKIKDIGGGVIEVGGNAFHAGKDFAGEIGDFFKFWGDGGIVTGPTMGIAGEKGPEAIIPLSRLADIIGNGLKGLVGGITHTLGGFASLLPNAIQGHISAGLAQFYISHTGPMQALSTGARYNGPSIPGLEMGDQVAFGRNPGNVQEWLEKIRAEAARRIDTRVAEIKIELSNAGVIGSQIELQNWLAQALTNLQRDGRLPASLNQVLGGLQ